MQASAVVAARVAEARLAQQERYAAAGFPAIRTNARCTTAMIEKYAEPDQSGLQLLRDAAERMKFSARGYHRILKVARTLADLEQRKDIGREQLAEALQYRQLDRLPAS